MKTLISDIRDYLNHHLTIPGFTRERITQLCDNDFQTIKMYEWRLLVRWSKLYVFQFEQLYNVQILTDNE